ncbi:hypothetical protein [Mycoplasmoides fastidiosum]|uniref:hypothetical protein n=1 Tax=Mycoplasmoides fastidiosum TaxID=92758 RepID=UPI002114AFA2|nr:hypothetical protein [Mycoplasmoides fastidiosum]UUD38116.1 hypothetical protein NPA10_01890 [Mycoplasmoides fastidiosum]
MKTNNQTLEFTTPKIIHCFDLLKTWKQILIDNPKTLVITPLTKIEDLYEIKSNSAFLSYLQKYLDQNFLNEEYLYKLEDIINNDLGNILEINNNNAKLIKILFEIKEQYVDSKILKFFLNKMIEHLPSIPILLIGWDEHFQELFDSTHNYNLVYFLTTNVEKLNLTKPFLELLVVQTKSDNFLEIDDFSLLKSFLEAESGYEIADHEIYQYFLGKNDENGYFWAKSLKKL